MIKRINRITGRRFWYSVRFVYKNDNNERIFDFVWEVGVVSKDKILDRKAIKKSIHSILMKAPKKYLVNGKLSMEIICYIGWFKK